MFDNFGILEFKLPGSNNLKLTQAQFKEFQEFKDEYIKELKTKKYLLQEINDNLAGRIDFRNLLRSGIRGFNVKDGEITADKLSVTTLSAITADLGTITAGDITLDDEGFIRTVGKDDYADEIAGFWLGYDTDKYKLNIGNANQYLKWTGSALSIKGSIDLVNTIDWQTDIAGTGKPADNADITLSAIQGELSLAGGGLVLASAGAKIRGGQTAYGVGTGFWLGDASGVSKFSIGSSANWLKWTGSALQIKGRLSIGAGTNEDIYFEDSAIRMYDDLDGTKKKIGWKYGALKFGEFFYNTTGRTHFVLRSGTNSYATVLYSRASDNTGFVFILGPADQMPCWIRLNSEGHIVLSAVENAPTENLTMGSFSYNSTQDRPVYRDNTAWRHWIGTTGW